jgi:hypothetical protein
VNWDKVDELVASWARPYTVFVCSTAIAICCFIPATAPIALPLAGALAGGAAVLRTIDKKTIANSPDPTKPDGTSHG